jgi:hypothetical protein
VQGGTAGTTTGVYYPTTNQVALAANGAQALLANSAQGVQIANTLGVGATTPSTSGAGITFPATQSASSDANTLDDYEEGTFTITPNANLTFNSIATTFSYVKVGRMVTVVGLVIVSTVSGSNTVNIGGLPFPVAGGPTNGYTSPTGPTMFSGVNSGSAGLASFVSQGSSTLTFYKLTQNAPFTQLTNSDLAASDEIYCNFSYFTNT